MFFILNSPNFQKLAILICNLFIGGQFQLAFIRFDSNSLNYRFLREINSNCPNDVTLIIINRNEIPQWNLNYTRDQILEINFLSQLPRQEVESSERYSAYYRLFIFNSHNEQNVRMKEYNGSTFNPGTNSMVLFHDTGNDETKARLLNDDFTLFGRSIEWKNESSSSESVFEMSFGEREKFRKLGVHRVIFSCDGKRPEILGTNNLWNYLCNFYFTQMNMLFIESGPSWCGLERIGSGYLYRHIRKPIYDDLSWDGEQIGNGTE